MRFKIGWAILIVGSKFTVFSLFYFVFEGNSPSTSPRGANIWRGDLTEVFLYYQFGGLIFGGAYFRNFTVFHYKGNKYCDSVNSTKLIDLKLYAFLQTSTWKIFACRGWKSLERFLHLYQETQHDLISWYFSRLASESSLLGD